MENNSSNSTGQKTIVVLVFLLMGLWFYHLEDQLHKAAEKAEDSAKQVQKLEAEVQRLTDRLTEVRKAEVHPLQLKTERLTAMVKKFKGLVAIRNETIRDLTAQVTALGNVQERLKSPDYKAWASSPSVESESGSGIYHRTLTYHHASTHSKGSGPVHVSGYYRNGHWVRPHYRSRPHRR